ncbi:hypothetical protein KM539_01420 [Xanthomonas translucens pv. poae]|uniref:hypothetical protein n=1 Tax=Xanthomonas graminis TaxID=3390026 RepID=UPI001112F0F8
MAVAGNWVVGSAEWAGDDPVRIIPDVSERDRFALHALRLLVIPPIVAAGSAVASAVAVAVAFAFDLPGPLNARTKAKAKAFAWRRVTFLCSRKEK